MKFLDFNNEQILAVCKKYHVKTVRVFGSFARGEATLNSDIDLLVTFSKPISLLQMVGLERELSKVSGHKIDILTSKTISPYLRTRIFRESRPIYAA